MDIFADNSALSRTKVADLKAHELVELIRYAVCEGTNDARLKKESNEFGRRYRG